jgi:insulysin
MSKKIKILLIPLVLSICISSCSSYKSVVDINKPHPTDKRIFRSMILDNKLEVLMVSDPTMNKSAAAMNVAVGSLENPIDALGMAHFLEHMLFLGTQKYPNVEEYSKYLSTNQGWSNAYTSLEKTNYHFEVNHDAFPGALDRFAQFFISPNFNKKYLKREKNAVHSEHQKNMLDDYWRERRVDLITSNSEHPIVKFSTGDLNTLKKINRKIIIEFYNKYYSANQMKLVILSKLPIDKIKELVKEKFSAIKNNDRKPLVYDSNVYDKNKLPMQVNIVPVAQKKNLKLIFPLPSSYNYYKTKPALIISSTIGHEGKGSLLSLLKSENLVTSLSAYPYSSSYNSMLNVSMSLTDEGEKNTNRIIELFYSYINLLKKTGYPDYYYKENRSMSEINYVFRSHHEGIKSAKWFASMMQHFPALDIEKKVMLIYDYSEKDYKQFLSLIRPDNMKIMYVSPTAKTDKVEKYYGTKYSVNKIDDKQSQKWLSMSIHPNLTFVESNPFIPSELSLIGDKSTSKPSNIIEIEKGELYYQPDNEILKPKAAASLVLLTNKINKNPKNLITSLLYVKSITETLREELYPARESGLNYSISSLPRGIKVKVNGFSDKLPLLFNKIFKSLKHIDITNEAFLAIRSDVKKGFINWNVSHAYNQGFDYLRSLIIKDRFHVYEYTDLIETISLEDVKKFTSDLFAEISIEGVAYGNIKKEKLVSIADKAFKALDAKPLPVPSRSKVQYVKLPKGKMQAFVRNVKDTNNFWLSTIQFGKRSYELDAISRIGSTHLETDFYSELRTKQQLGYVVWSNMHVTKDTRGMYFAIQSPKYSPLEIEKRAKKFLKSAIRNMKKIKPEKLENYKSAIIKKLQEKDKTIQEKLNYLYNAAFLYAKDFNYRNRIIESVKKVKLDDIVSTYTKSFKNKEKRELGVFLVKKGSKLVKPKGSLIKDITKFKKPLPVYN